VLVDTRTRPISGESVIERASDFKVAVLAEAAAGITAAISAARSGKSVVNM